VLPTVTPTETPTTVAINIRTATVSRSNATREFTLPTLSTKTWRHVPWVALDDPMRPNECVKWLLRVR
jgi:hypothetical protein